ncbi:hypothetical protein DFP74_2328 [Nocardiopsis sp. Huas11]|nr:hypothetical protein DFP74_2328 [Nocardiopsis sp. Huas11]
MYLVENQGTYSRLRWFKDNSDVRPDGVNIGDIAAYLEMNDLENNGKSAEFYKQPPGSRAAKTKGKGLGPTSINILQSLQMNGPMTRDEIKSHMENTHGTDKNTTHNTLKRLVNDHGKVEALEDGTYQAR